MLDDLKNFCICNLCSTQHGMYCICTPILISQCFTFVALRSLRGNRNSLSESKLSVASSANSFALTSLMMRSHQIDLFTRKHHRTRCGEQRRSNSGGSKR